MPRPSLAERPTFRLMESMRPRCCFVLVLCLLGLRPLVAKEETWRKLSTPEFTLLTSLAEKDATRWTKEFAQFVAALRDHFHYKGALPPLTMVVFAKTADFERFRPLRADGKPEEVDGFFYRHGSWSVAGLSGTTLSDEAKRIILHEGVHWFLSQIDPPNPVWLEEGMAEVFSTFTTRKDKAEWGQPIGDHVALLNLSKPLPLERLLFTGHSDLFGDDSLHTSMVYAESWAFVHFMIFGQKNIPTTAMADYFDARRKGQHPDEAFHVAFGKTYAEMDKLLARYLSDGKYYMHSQPLAALPEIAVAPASPAEVDLALGRLALAARRRDVAAARARSYIAAASADPRGHELLGDVYDQNDHAEEAKAEYELAVQLGTKDFEPYFDLAQREHSEAMEQGAESLSSTASRRIANRYEQVINLNPRYRPAYQNLAGVLGVVEPWSDEDRKFVEFGLQIFPDDAMLQLGAALLTYRAGDHVKAHAQLDAVLAITDGLSGKTKAYARQIESMWQQQEIINRIETLTNEEKYPEAIAFVEDSLKQNLDSRLRFQLVRMKTTLRTEFASKNVKDALDDRRFADARRALEEYMKLDIPAAMRAQAKATLAKLDEQKLGLEKAESER